MKLLPSLLSLTLALPAAVAAQSIDTAGIGRMLDQGTNHSEVMQNLQHLSDVIGPRLSGSPAMRRANEWTGSRFKAYGVPNRLEAYEFGVTWERGPATMRLLAPFTRAVTAHSWAWTEGTGGKSLSGPVVLVDIAVPESLAVYRDKLEDAWVLPRRPFPVLNPDGPVTPEDSAAV
jgi:carboxypeptidase Q